MIELNNVSLYFDGAAVLEDLSLSLPAGAHVAFMGPSGCGKTSLLRLAAGLEKPTAGCIKTGSRRIAYVFQEPRLLPWRSVLENVNAVLSDQAATLPLAGKWLSLVGLADAAEKYPHELSGGMRQRVNLARALAYDGDILLLDEPLSGLDDARRSALLPLIQEHAAGKTLLLATHSAEEAAALAGSVYVYENRRFIPAG